MENRGPSYPSECHPLDIGDPYEIEKAHSSMTQEERQRNPLRKGELLKKIIKRQMAEYEVGIFTINPKHFQWNIFSKPYPQSQSPSLPNNYIDALAYIYENNAPVAQEMSDRDENPNDSEQLRESAEPIATEVINVPIVSSEIAPDVYLENQEVEAVNESIVNDNRINELRIKQDNWLYDNINLIRRMQFACDERTRCCLTITLTTGFISGLYFGFGGKRMKSKRKTKKGRNKKTKRKSNKSLKKFRPNIKSNRKKRGSCKGRSTCKK